MHVFNTAKELQASVNKRVIPLPFKVNLSLTVCQAFYRHFYVDDGGKAMLASIFRGINPEDEIIQVWLNEYDLFGERLLRGEFIIPLASRRFNRYLIHYTAGPFIESITDSKEFFDFKVKPTNSELLSLWKLTYALNELWDNMQY